MDQWNKINNTEINTFTVDFNKGVKTIQWGEIFHKWFWDNRVYNCKINEVGLLPSTILKTNSK